MKRVSTLAFSIILALAIVLPSLTTPPPIDASSVYDANGAAYFSSNDTTLVTYSPWSSSTEKTNFTTEVHDAWSYWYTATGASGTQFQWGGEWDGSSLAISGHPINWVVVNCDGSTAHSVTFNSVTATCQSPFAYAGIISTSPSRWVVMMDDYDGVGQSLYIEHEILHTFGLLDAYSSPSFVHPGDENKTLSPATDCWMMGKASGSSCGTGNQIYSPAHPDEVNVAKAALTTASSPVTPAMHGLPVLTSTSPGHYLIRARIDQSEYRAENQVILVGASPLSFQYRPLAPFVSWQNCSVLSTGDCSIYRNHYPYESYYYWYYTIDATSGTWNGWKPSDGLCVTQGAANRNGYSTPSNTCIFNNQLSGANLALTGLYTTATLTWTDSNTEDAYKIDRFSYGSGTWTTLTSSLAAGSTTYTDTTATTNNMFCYSVIPRYGGADLVTHAQTDLLCYNPNSNSGSQYVTDLKLQLSGTNILTLTWTPGGIQDGYALIVARPGQSTQVINLSASASGYAYDTTGHCNYGFVLATMLSGSALGQSTIMSACPIQ